MSLANVLAVRRRRESIVLLGDPQQLDQPTKGRHPAGAEGSALEHLLGEQQTMPDRRLFLETTWRLHPAFARSRPRRSTRASSSRSPASSASARGQSGSTTAQACGSCRSSTKATDNASAEEAEAVGAICRALVSRRRPGWTRRQSRRQIGWTTSSIVAPYNAQVAGPEAAAAEARGSAPSTSSRARRRRSIYSWPSSTPTTRRAAWSSSTASTASTSRPRARVRGGVVAAARSSSGPSPHPARCGSRTPSHAIGELACDSAPGYWAAPRADPLIGVSILVGHVTGELAVPGGPAVAGGREVAHVVDRVVVVDAHVGSANAG